jgi:hypothetical protein
MVNTIQVVSLGDGRGIKSVYFLFGHGHPPTRSNPLVLPLLLWILFENADLSCTEIADNSPVRFPLGSLTGTNVVPEAQKAGWSSFIKVRAPILSFLFLLNTNFANTVFPVP